MVVIFVVVLFIYFVVKAKEVILDLSFRKFLLGQKSAALNSAKEAIESMDNLDPYVLYGMHCLRSEYSQSSEGDFSELDEDHTDIFLTLNALDKSKLSMRYMAKCYVQFLLEEAKPGKRILKEFHPEELLFHLLQKYSTEEVVIANANDKENIQRYFKDSE